jgi:nicotinate phosphoribosyltransferase
MPRFSLPADHRPYTDKYFLHTKRILDADGLNPRVTMQVFIRQGPGVVRGVDEAVAVIEKYADPAAGGIEVYAVPEGTAYGPKDSLLHIVGPYAAFAELETLYLGVITAATTMENDADIDLAAVRAKAGRIRALMPDKDLMYFGARHWHFSRDAEISRAAVEGGFSSCSTDVGAKAAGLAAGVGTIPHALCLVYGHAFGRERGTVEAAKAFDRHIEAENPRIALVDTFEREIDDSLSTAREVSRLAGVRLDTAGESLAQGGLPFDGRTYWTGPGVTVEGVAAVRRALDAAGLDRVSIVLSSGFGDEEKLRAFAEGERRHGRLFTSLGIGGIFPARHATADIVQIEGRDFAKVGRSYRENPLMRRVL